LMNLMSLPTSIHRLSNLILLVICYCNTSLAPSSSIFVSAFGVRRHLLGGRHLFETTSRHRSSIVNFARRGRINYNGVFATRSGERRDYLISAANRRVSCFHALRMTQFEGTVTTSSTRHSLLSNFTDIQRHMNGIADNGNKQINHVTEELISNSTIVNNKINFSNVSFHTNNNNENTNNNSDIPLPTPNGGFTHTNTSKAKISAANKGKTPWNKGRTRSPEERARISAGVRARNRVRFLAKLSTLNMTEAEWNEQKAEEKRRMRAERDKRRTANGGFKPTDETRKKISQALTQRYADGVIVKRRKAVKSRKGLKHSQATKDKISASLKAKWKYDEGYRENMLNKTVNRDNEQWRSRISATLKEKWKDSEFRTEMMKHFRKRHGGTANGTEMTDEQRRKISEAMKARWRDDQYRAKAVDGMRKWRNEAGIGQKKRKKKKKKIVATVLQVNGQDTTTAAVVKKKVKKVKKKIKKKVKKKQRARVLDSIANGQVNGHAKQTKKNTAKFELKLPLDTTNNDKDKPAPAAADAVITQVDDERVQKMKEERRELYNLLYGEDDDDFDDGGEDEVADGSWSADFKIGGDLGFFGLNGDETELGNANLERIDPQSLEVTRNVETK